MATAISILGRSSSAVLKYLRSLPSPSRDSAVLYAVSSNADDIQALNTHLSSLSSNTIGCVSSPLPSAENLVSCSIATFAPKSFTLFRSEIPGREKSQVGRWRPPNLEAHEQKQKRTVDSAVDGAARLPGHDGNWSDVWGMNDTWSGLPDGLSKSQDVQSLVYLSDDASEGLARSLDINFPHACKMGLIASSTPFLTGRPFTIMHGTRVLSSGAVGLALRSQSRPSLSTKFDGLVPISPVMRVTSCESNIIHTLGNDNPAQLLLSSIKKHRLKNADTSYRVGKDDKYYLAVSTNEPKQPYERAYLINSGDPSRGPLALDADQGPIEGSSVQFMYLPPAHTFSLPPHDSSSDNSNHLQSLSFSTTSRDTISTTPDGSEEGVEAIGGSFLGASENGFVSASGDGREAWKCTTEGGSGTLHWT